MILCLDIIILIATDVLITKLVVVHVHVMKFIELSRKKHGKKEVYKLQKFSHPNDSFIKSLSNKQKWKDLSHISCRGGTLLLLLVICIHNKQAMDVFWEFETKVRMSMQKLQLGSIEESSSIYLFFVSLNEILIRLDGADEHCSM